MRSSVPQLLIWGSSVRIRSKRVLVLSVCLVVSLTTWLRLLDFMKKLIFLYLLDDLLRKSRFISPMIYRSLLC